MIDTLFPDLAETNPVGRPTSPGNGASQQTDGLNAQGALLAAHARHAAPVGLADVPGALRTFADVPLGRDAWRFWDPGTAPAQAALEYRARLGAWPAAVIRNPKGGHTLAGPLPTGSMSRDIEAQL